jgi:spore coat polysaccharide biosynthesis protein SpsF
MKTLAILQARMSSTRFPGKVLAPLQGKPMILRQLERIRRAKKLDGVVVATSTDPSDDLLTRTLEAENLLVVRGELDDVLERYVRVIDEFKPDTVVRLTGDCPLTSPAVIDKVIAEFQQADVDYASNTLEPTYPDGLDVEVIRASVLQAYSSLCNDSAEREHVTLGIYRHPETYSLFNIRHRVDLSDLRWTVDNEQDFQFVDWVYETLLPQNAEFDLEQILSLVEKFPEKSRTESDAVRNESLRGLNIGAMRLKRT